MTLLRRLPPLVVAIVATATLMVGCGAQAGPQDTSTTAPQPPSQAAPSSPAAAPALPAPESTVATGSYVEYADYLADPGSFSSTDVVLFFHAPWCPSCRATEDDIEARRSSLPAGLTLVKVDFDSQQALRKTYGVTTQHTFVQIDADGTELSQWNGSLTVDAIAAQIA
jgi:thioredoxin 1